MGRLLPVAGAQVLFLAGFLALLLLAVLVQWPARELAALGALERSSLAASRWSGTAWRGEAEGLYWGELRLGALRWRLAPLSLLTLRPRAALTLEGPEITASGTVRVGLTGADPAATDVRLLLPANWLQRVLDQPFLQLGGSLRAELEAVRFRDGWLTEVTGITRWEDAVVRGRIEAPLGGITVRWSTGEDGAILGEVTDSGGPLGAVGTITVAERTYQLDLRLSAPAEDVPLRQALAVLGRPDASGAVRLLITGPMVPIQ